MSAVLDRLAASPPAKGREEIADRLFELFREQGYDGASIAEIARVTGLKRPSLYHYFPGGKAEMAEAVAARAREAVAASVVAALSAPLDRVGRVGGMLSAVRSLYDDGRRPCVVASLMVGDAPECVTRAAGALIRDWIDALAAALTATGAAPDAAERAATDAVGRIQGALIVSRALDDPAPFRNAVEAVERALAEL